MIQIFDNRRMTARGHSGLKWRENTIEIDSGANRRSKYRKLPVTQRTKLEVIALTLELTKVTGPRRRRRLDTVKARGHHGHERVLVHLAMIHVRTKALLVDLGIVR